MPAGRRSAPSKQTDSPSGSPPKAECQVAAHGLVVQVTFRQHARGYSAELSFGEGDRAVIDGRTMEELVVLVDRAARAGALARRAPALVRQRARVHA